MNDYHKLCKDTTGSFLQTAGKMDALKWLEARVEPVPLDDNPNPSASPNTETTTNSATGLSAITLVAMTVIMTAIF